MFLQPAPDRHYRVYAFGEDDRYGCVTDPYGHVWAIAAQQEVLDPIEVQRRMQVFAAHLPTRNSKGNQKQKRRGPVRN